MLLTNELMLLPRKVKKHGEHYILHGGITYLIDGKPMQAAVSLGLKRDVTALHANQLVKVEREHGVHAPVLAHDNTRLDDAA